jgi:hypothetical protein
MNNYEISEAGVKYSGATIPVTLSWAKMRGIHKPLFSAQLRIRGGEGIIPVPTDAQDAKIFLQNFYRAWRERDSDAAKKNAFDYVDSKKGFAKVQLVVSLVFCLGLAFLLIGDSYQQRRCSQLLEQGSAPGLAEIVKLKRKRAGHYILDLSLTVGDKTYLGRDQIIATVDKTPETPLSVIYAKGDPSCFAIADSQNAASAEWAKRRFFTGYLFFFGLFFLVTGLWGVVTAVARLTEERPNKDEIIRLFGLQL